MSISAKERREIPDSEMGVPGKDKYPLRNPHEIKSANNLINNGDITPEEKKALARKIRHRAEEEGMDTSKLHAANKVAGVAEQVPPMSDGTSIGNSPPRTMAPYYDEANEELAQKLAATSSQMSSGVSMTTEEDDELLSRVKSIGVAHAEAIGKRDMKAEPFLFAQKIVKEISAQVEKDSKPPTGNQNCELCTWCAEARYRGINALPRPIYSPRDPALPGNGHHHGEDIVMNPIKESFRSQRDVIKKVRGNVDSRWYVHVNWKDSTGGHEFLVVNINDYAYIMDAQAGILKEIDESDSTHNYFRDINFKNSYMVRLDTRKFNAELFNDVNNPDNVLPWDPKKDVPYMRDQGMIGDVSSQYTMRPATDSDLDFVYQSELETIGENKDDPKVQKYIRKDAKDSLGHTKIIVMDDTDIGVYQAYETNYYGLREGTRDWWYLAHIYIKPEYRNLGIGSDIIKKDIKTHDKILLQVMKSNTLAKKLYESLGFVVDMENDHGGLVMRLDKSKPVQESSDPAKLSNKLIPVKDYPFDTVYKGAMGELKTNPLFVTPYKGIASIFAAHDAFVEKLHKMGLRSFNSAYDEWNWSAGELLEPLKTVHVKIHSYEGKTFEPFEIDAEGFLYTFDVSNLKDKIYRYDWMDPDKEALVANYGQIEMPGAEKVTIHYIVEPVKHTQEGTLQESTNVFESGHFSKYKDHVLGFNDDGMAVMKKCDCGGNISVSMKGEPVYTCESCGKTYGVVAYQEGAFQDLKNGVNPYSDKMVFHVTPEKHADGQVWKPRVPDYLDPYNPEETGFEDNTTPRICFSTSIEGCLNGITVNLPRQNPDQFDKLYVYIPEKPWKQYKHKTNKELVKDKLVYDANVTREVWIMEPVRMKLYGVIRVDQVSNVKRKPVVPTSKGEKGDRNYFTYKWHWVVKPKVLAKATKFDYSPENVIADLCIDLKKFKYGLIRNGRLQSGDVSESDYEKYWVFHSGQEVDEAGGGNCYDMVEYEAGYLEAFGVAYKKYFMSFTDKKNEMLGTHTICVVPLNGKYIYIEQAFKRVTDEWGYERQKTFDKLNGIFDYVAECMADYEGKSGNFGVWDYTNTKIDYGTPIKEFMQTIMSGKMIYDGEADPPNNIKEEGYEMSSVPTRFGGNVYTESAKSKSKKTVNRGFINTSQYKPLYMILLSEKDFIAKVIRKCTNSEWSHCALSLDAGMNKIYSFNIAHSKGSAFKIKPLGGFSQESLFDPGQGDLRARIYAVYVPEAAYERVKDKVDEWINNPKSTQYDYMAILKRIFVDDIEKSENNNKMVCSSFVNNILALAGRSMSEKNLPSPQDMDDEARVHPNDCFKIYDGLARDYEVEKTIEILDKNSKERDSKPFVEWDDIYGPYRNTNGIPSRFYQEEDMLTSKDLEIKVGDLDLDKDNEPKSENDELPGYLEGRMSDDDLKKFKETEDMDPNDVELGQFGSDTGDVQNDYDPKDVETLMKLMASEADALGEYLDAAKETNTDVLRRLYADIGNEERFHMEQLLFAKSELTGEKYVPKDPEVKKEYEELLEMGMDEETAMQTAVDKCHIRVTTDDDDMSFENATKELESDIKNLQETFELIEITTNMILESSDRAEMNGTISMILESTIFQEEFGTAERTWNIATSINPFRLLGNLLGKAITFIFNTVNKFRKLFNKFRNRVNVAANFVKENGYAAIFQQGIHLYFNPTYLNTGGYTVTAEVYKWQVLIESLHNKCVADLKKKTLVNKNDPGNMAMSGLKPIQVTPVSSEQSQKYQVYKNDPQVQTCSRDIPSGIIILDRLDLMRTKIPVPADEMQKQILFTNLTGYSEEKTTAAKSNNYVNTLFALADSWKKMMAEMQANLNNVTDQRNQAASQYNKLATKNDIAYKGMKACVDSCSKFCKCFTSDIQEIIHVCNKVYGETEAADQADIKNNPQLAVAAQNYTDKVGKFASVNPGSAKRSLFI